MHDFLSTLDDYKPTIPEAATQYSLERSGVNVYDDRILKLVSLAADKLLVEALHESREQALLKKKNNPNKRKIDPTVDTLTVKDLEGCMAQLKSSWKKPLKQQKEDK